MRKFFTNIIGLTSLLIAYLVVMNIFQKFYNNDPSHYSLQYQEANQGGKSYEGIIIGTSHTTHSMMPSILDSSNIDFYNFALDGSNSTYYNHWYDKVFKANNNDTKVCVIGIDWFMFDKKRLWRIFEHDAEYFNHGLFNDLLFSKDFNAQSLIMYRFPALKYREAIFQSLTLQKGDNDYPVRGYQRGFIPIEIPFDARNFSKKLVTQIDTSEVASFKILVNKLIKDDVNVIFVMVPEYGRSSLDYEKSASLELVNQMSSELNIPFLNFNTHLRSSFNDDISSFADMEHLNEAGSKIFSTSLSNKIDSLVRIDLLN